MLETATSNSSANEINAACALKQAKRQTLLAQAIPTWPDKLFGILLVVMASCLLDLNGNHHPAMVQAIGIGALVGLLLLQQYINRLLRQRIEALSALWQEG